MFKIFSRSMVAPVEVVSCYNGVSFIMFQRGQYEETNSTCLRSSVARWWPRWRLLVNIMVRLLSRFREDSTRGQTERV